MGPDRGEFTSPLTYKQLFNRMKVERARLAGPEVVHFVRRRMWLFLFCCVYYMKETNSTGMCGSLGVRAQWKFIHKQSRFQHIFNFNILNSVIGLTGSFQFFDTKCRHYESPTSMLCKQNRASAAEQFWDHAFSADDSLWNGMSGSGLVPRGT
jgi:hypothetical protein